MISSNKQQTSAFLISAPAFRPQLVPASRPLPFPVPPPPCPPVPLHSNFYWIFCHRVRYSLLPSIVCWDFIWDIVIMSFSRANKRIDTICWSFCEILSNWFWLSIQRNSNFVSEKTESVFKLFWNELVSSSMKPNRYLWFLRSRVWLVTIIDLFLWLISL